MKKKHFLLFIFTVILLLPATAQTIPSKAKALSDFKLKKESIEKQLKFLGIESGLKDVKVEHTGGPYRRYSIGARTYYYDHVSDLDAAYHTFKLTTPEYPNGDKFVLRVEIDYNSFVYQSSGYRRSLGKYELRSAKVSVYSYEGKELTNAQLLEKLNDLSIKKGKAFEVDNRYHFTEIKDVQFSKLKQHNNQGTSMYTYEIKITGIGAEFGSQGDDYIEYEIKKTADLEAYYTAEIGLIKGEWIFVDYSLKPNRAKTIISNIVENPNVPAYECLRYKTLKETMNGPIVSDQISIYSNKYMNDLKSLIIFRLHTVPKEEFIQGDFLTNLFSNDQGKSFLNQFYSLKRTMKDYYLDSVNCRYASYGTRISKNGEGQFQISYSVKREVSKELLKKAKANGANKAQLAVIKYRSSGYYNLSAKLAIVNGKVVVSDVILPEQANEIVYYNGGSTKRHPIVTE